MCVAIAVATSANEELAIISTQCNVHGVDVTGDGPRRSMAICLNENRHVEVAQEVGYLAERNTCIDQAARSVCLPHNGFVPYPGAVVVGAGNVPASAT